jgi:hypothetical protein
MRRRLKSSETAKRATPRGQKSMQPQRRYPRFGMLVVNSLVIQVAVSEADFSSGGHPLSIDSQSERVLEYLWVNLRQYHYFHN